MKNIRGNFGRVHIVVCIIFFVAVVDPHCARLCHHYIVSFITAGPLCEMKIRVLCDSAVRFFNFYTYYTYVH